MALPTLLNTRSPLADTATQRETLAALPLARTFEDSLDTPLHADGISVLQINVGKRCNQACRHCHVDAGPDRTEVLPADVVEACLRFLHSTDIPTLDITGGAPELHTQFREIVRRARAAGRHVIDRCSLSITRFPYYAYPSEFIADHQVEVIATFPSLAPRQSDAQRGVGLYDDPPAALRRFLHLGYGLIRPGLLLNIVPNPV